jgi:asparagine synthase (glutamine-hydrolysing)
MCGFVAIRGRRHAGELARMATAVAMRGPDGHGSFEAERFGAIHHRLSIIGPDARGTQPMTIGDVTVVFNGCIYNYHELRRRMEADGIVFDSDSDTEILPHLYNRFGTGMFALLNGMFAIVLWDAAHEVLLIARDPFGEKPLYICEQEGRIGIASLLTAFEKGNWQLTPDTDAVQQLLARMRIEAPATLYREVRQLPAGCYAIAAADQGLSLRRYHFMPEPDQPLDLSDAEIEGEVAGLLDEVFLSRTMADRPMGVFLSGGVDSSLIAESLARQRSETLHTFSVRFADGPADYDESAHAATVADHIGSAHTVLEVTADAHATLAALAEAFDQPVANSAALPTWLISRAAKAHVDVALSGVGGDELFGGYPRYLGMHWHARLRHMPLRKSALQLLSRSGDAAGSRNLRGRLRRFLAGLDREAAAAYLDWTGTGVAADTMLTQPVTEAGHGWPTAMEANGGLAALLARFGPVNGAMAADVLAYLPDDLLAMGDRMSMAHALELRAPFLDTRLHAMMQTLDARWKVKGMPWQENLKVLLRRIARTRLPADIVDRPKQGFMAPVKHWLRGELAVEVAALTERDPVGGLVRREFVKGEWSRHQAGEDRSDILWALLLLDRWAAARDWKFD